MNYFIFNGLDSRDFGIHIDNEPNIVKPTRKLNTVSIDGRSGYLLYSDIDNEEVLDSFSLSITCTLSDESKLPDVMKWLTGYGGLTLSNNSDKYYNALIINQISFERVFRRFKAFTVIFECQPFAYEIENETILKTVKNNSLTFTIENNANTFSKPLITVYGNGEVDLVINGKILNLTVDEYITIDFDLQNATKGILNRNNCVVGDYSEFRFEVGTNTITVNGNATKIEVTPNFRWY